MSVKKSKAPRKKAQAKIPDETQTSQLAPEHVSPPELMDTRLRERHLRSGRLTTADVKSYLESLPDVIHKVARP